MDAALLTHSDFSLQVIGAPAPGPNEVLVRTLACGICEGDLFVYRNRQEYAKEPLLLGHEGSGIVEAVGERVTTVAPGDLVTALGGAYGDYFVAPETMVAPLPAGVDPRLALGEPVACCVHAGNRFGVRPGDRVAVVGCGFMGLVCLQLARIQGASYICAIDPLEERRAMALQLGADAAHSSDALAEPVDLVALGEFAVVIEAAGVPSAIDLATALVAQHGRIVLVGYHQSHGGLRTVNMQQWNFKAIDVVNGHVRRDDEKYAAMRQGLDLMAAGRLTTAPLVTTYALTETQRAFDDLLNRKPGLFKAVLVPTGSNS